MEKFTINIAKDFSTALGGRSKSIGEFSGEAFFEQLLNDKYSEAVAAGEKLYVNLDGTGSYGSSFLDESFGKLARENGVEEVRNNIVFRTSTFQWIVDYINTEIWGKR